MLHDVAIANRKALLERAVTDEIKLLGFHWSDPGVGYAEQGQCLPLRAGDLTMRIIISMLRIRSFKHPHRLCSWLPGLALSDLVETDSAAGQSRDAADTNRYPESGRSIRRPSLRDRSSRSQ